MGTKQNAWKMKMWLLDEMPFSRFGRLCNYTDAWLDKRIKVGYFYSKYLSLPYITIIFSKIQKQKNQLQARLLHLFYNRNFNFISEELQSIPIFTKDKRKKKLESRGI